MSNRIDVRPVPRLSQLRKPSCERPKRGQGLGKTQPLFFGSPPKKKLAPICPGHYVEVSQRRLPMTNDFFPASDDLSETLAAPARQALPSDPTFQRIRDQQVGVTETCPKCR